MRAEKYAKSINLSKSDFRRKLIMLRKSIQNYRRSVILSKRYSPYEIRKQLSGLRRKMWRQYWRSRRMRRKIRRCNRARKWLKKVKRVISFYRLKMRKETANLIKLQRSLSKLRKSALKNTKQCAFMISYKRGKLRQTQFLLSNYRGKLKMILTQARRDRNWECRFGNYDRKHMKALRSFQKVKSQIRRFKFSRPIQMKRYYDLRSRLTLHRQNYFQQYRDYQKLKVNLAKKQAMICKYKPNFFTKRACKNIHRRLRRYRHLDRRIKTGSYDFSIFFSFMRRSLKTKAVCSRNICISIILRRFRRRLRLYRRIRRRIQRRIRRLTRNLDNVNKMSLKYAAVYRAYIRAARIYSRRKSKRNERRQSIAHLKTLRTWRKYVYTKARNGGSASMIIRKLARQRRRLRRVGREIFRARRILKSGGRLVCGRSRRTK